MQRTPDPAWRRSGVTAVGVGAWRADGLILGRRAAVGGRGPRWAECDLPGSRENTTLLAEVCLRVCRVARAAVQADLPRNKTLAREQLSARRRRLRNQQAERLCRLQRTAEWFAYRAGHLGVHGGGCPWWGGGQRLRQEERDGPRWGPCTLSKRVHGPGAGCRRVRGRCVGAAWALRRRHHCGARSRGVRWTMAAARRVAGSQGRLRSGRTRQRRSSGARDAGDG